MGMDIGEFEEAATTWLNELFELLELEDAEAKLDLRMDDGEMDITIDEEQKVSLTAQSSSNELVMVSPLSGTLHFTPIEEGADWTLDDGRRLSVVLSEELKQLTGEEFTPNVV